MERSEEINELATALAKAQGSFRPAIKDSSAKIQSRKEGGANYSYKFADLAAVVECCRDALSANGLAVLQPPESSSDGQITIHTILTHSSGQWMASRMELNYQGQDVKQIGSAITYLRRYAFTSFVGVVTDDDDADSAPPMQYRDRQQERPYDRQPGRKQEGRPSARDEAPSRDEINRQFAPSGGAPAGPAPLAARPTNDKEVTKFRGDRIGAKGLDVRTVDKLLADEIANATAAVNDERKGHDLEPVGLTTSIEATKHLIKAAREAGDTETPEPMGPDGKYVRVGIGKLGAHLSKLYLQPEWREWLRKDLKEYLVDKVTKARQVTRNEAYGDEPRPEEESQDAGPKPEDESQLVPAGDVEDDGWVPGRE